VPFEWRDQCLRIEATASDMTLLVAAVAGKSQGLFKSLIMANQSDVMVISNMEV